MEYSKILRRMQLDCGSWILWLINRIGRNDDKLGGGRKGDKIQQTAKHYDSNGHVKDAGLSLLAAVILVTRAFPPQTNKR